MALATRNPGKVGEIRLGLEGMHVAVTTVDDYPGFPEIEETEATLHGNAARKSEALFDYSGVPSLADDTGLEVEALDGEPGVKSARYAGEGCTPADNRRLLLDQMAGVEERSARFRTVLAFTDKKGTKYFEGACDGEILTSERGSGGFGYDAIFRPYGSDKSFAELATHVKNEMSHRGKAVRSFCEFMREHMG